MRNLILCLALVLGLFTAGCIYETPYDDSYTPVYNETPVIYSQHTYYVEDDGPRHIAPPPRHDRPRHDDHHKKAPVVVQPHPSHSQPPRPQQVKPNAPHHKPAKPGNEMKPRPGRPGNTLSPSHPNASKPQAPGKNQHQMRPSTNKPQGQPHHPQQNAPALNKPTAPQKSPAPASRHPRH